MENASILEKNTKQSFAKVKSEISGMKAYFNQQSTVIQQLYENQKVLLMRLREIEKKI